MHPWFRSTLDLFEPDQAPAAFTHPRANREACLCDVRVAYELKRGKRRTIGFVVGPDGLAVSAPKWVSLSDVDAALRKKAAWVVKKLEASRERQARVQAAHIVWRDGALLPFLGQQIRVVIDPSHAFGAKGAVLSQRDAAALDLSPAHEPPLSLQVSLPHSATSMQIRDAVQAWLMREARRLFVERLDHYAPQLQVQWRKLSLSNAGTRWGSARTDGSIRLNWRLIHFTPAVIDYVVAHELSHLRVMDHSPRFWDALRSVMPDYASRLRQLKDEAVPHWQ